MNRGDGTLLSLLHALPHDAFGKPFFFPVVQAFYSFSLPFSLSISVGSTGCRQGLGCGPAERPCLLAGFASRSRIALGRRLQARAAHCCALWHGKSSLACLVGRRVSHAEVDTVLSNFFRHCSLRSSFRCRCDGLGSCSSSPSRRSALRSSFSHWRKTSFYKCLRRPPTTCEIYLMTGARKDGRGLFLHPQGYWPSFPRWQGGSAGHASNSCNSRLWHRNKSGGNS
ncbi:hypothetical protein MPH_05145 [Macrophomina phaseolina MS6]|uniref:Uncharacterized protein n=1 Tax=Macrophomina phaseolina (strain MS6) TaxID=1126212 RepID=K2R5P1_MACPH|nr:hypothetical protein MPH_05145 [Macrophomina phaseolina MS6]